MGVPGLDLLGLEGAAYLSREGVVLIQFGLPCVKFVQFLSRAVFPTGIRLDPYACQVDSLGGGGCVEGNFLSNYVFRLVC